LTRIGLLSGFSSDRSFLRQFLGYSGQQLTSIFPSFVNILSTQANIASEKLIINHSVLPFFRPFSHRKIYDTAIVSLKNGRVVEAYSQFSLLANRIPESKHLYFCPQCLYDDVKKNGVAYWHVQHQLPWCDICYLHNINLHVKTRRRKRLELPPQVFDHRSIKLCHADANLTSIAVNSVKLWRLNQTSLDLERVTECYKNALYQTGMASTSGSVLQQVWRRSLEVHWSASLPQELGSVLFNSKNFQTFPNNLIYQSSAQHHPIKHLLVIIHLFGGIDEFLTCYHNKKFCMTSNTSNNVIQIERVPQRKQQVLVNELKNGASMRQAAKSAKVSIGFAKSQAIQHDILIERREQWLFAHERRQILNWLKEGKPTQEIATFLTCSVGSVEQLLTQHPVIKKLRKKLRFFKRQQGHRCTLLAWIAGNQNATRGQIQSAKRTTYTWLFKHDKQWLYENLPDAIPHKERYKN
jgi:hypothetical protein